MMKKIDNRYEKLALYLQPDKINEGKKEIDRAILAGLRRRSAHRNLRILLTRGGSMCLGVGLGAVLTYYIMDLSDIDRMLNLEYMRNGAKYIGISLVIIGALMLKYGCNMEYDIEWPDPPERIATWLAQNRDDPELKYGLRYWYQIEWSCKKRHAQAWKLWHFTFWRKEPKEIEE